MAAIFKVRIFTGPNGSTAGKRCAHEHRTLAGAQACAERVRREDGHGAGILIRLAPGEPWRFTDEGRVD
jgi:hypothetical protein